MTTPTIITVAFGSAGSSWFALLGEKDGKLIGLRWTPGYRQGTGSWGNPVTLAADLKTGRRPTCDRPLPPAAELIEKLLVKSARQKAANKARLALVKEFQKRLDAGEQVTVTHKFRAWLADEATAGERASGWVERTEEVRVVGTKGMRVSCIIPRYHVERPYLIDVDRIV